MKVRRCDNGTRWVFRCPGCRENHYFDQGWSFNGDLDKPTISPSLLVRSGHYIDGFSKSGQCWCTWRGPDGKPAPFKCFQCHSFVRDGMIQFLDDCTHELKGQTVEIPEWPNGAGADV